MPKRRKKSTQLSGPGAIAFLILLTVVLLYSAWEERENIQIQPSGPIAPLVTVDSQAGSTGGAGDAITVWFTEPLSGKNSGGIENHMIAAIDAAQTSVDVAIYNISLENLGNALIRAKQRGVTVRIVIESEAMERNVPRALADAGIPLVGDQRQGLMHNKFVIIDSQEVWTGSMNFTSTSVYKDFNNLVRVRSQHMVSNYQAEFNEKFVDKRFGPTSTADTPYPRFTINGVPVEVYFSPEDGVAKNVIAELQRAQKSIVILAYSFTSDDFAEAIHQRAAAGVVVRGVFDEGQNLSNQGGEFSAFQEAGYDVKIDGISGLLHHKVFIIDGQVVITGSYNFSANAERVNDENLVIIRDATIARQFLQHFEEVYGSAK